MSTALILKLTLAPALIGCISLIQRRWGASLGGLLGGLPVTVGPALLVLAIENGPRFATVAAVSSVQALVAVATFSAVYALTAVHWRLDWTRSLAVALGAYLGLIWVVSLLPDSLGLAIVLAAVAQWAAYRIIPAPGADAIPRTQPPSWDLPLRMAAAVLLVWGVAELAETLGAKASGLLSPFPVPALILGVFTHRHDGAGVASRLLRSLVLGLFSREAFCAVTAAGLPVLGTGAAFTLATACSVATQAALWWYWRRRSHA